MNKLPYHWQLLQTTQIYLETLTTQRIAKLNYHTTQKKHSPHGMDISTRLGTSWSCQNVHATCTSGTFKTMDTLLRKTQHHIYLQEITVKDNKGELQMIPQLRANESQKLLGVMKNPMGDQQDEITRLKQKSDNITKRINTNKMTRAKAKLAYEAF
jgi:hypothetical protein